MGISPTRIIIGTSGVKQPGWIETDVEYLNLLDLNHWTSYFQKNSIDAVLAEHVWEHLSLSEGQIAAQYCYEFLKPGGYLRVAVPDGFHPDEEYIQYVKPGGTGSGAKDHKVLYDHFTFTNIFEKAGFDVQLLEYFDSYGKFHSIQWNPEDGKINRSIRFDERNKDGSPIFGSLILDARKVTGSVRALL